MEGHPGNDSGLIVVLELPCYVVPHDDYLSGANWGQIQPGPSGYTHRSVCILQGRWSWSDIQQSGKSWWGWWYQPQHILEVATIIPGLTASYSSEASSGQSGVCGVVSHSSWGSGSYSSNTASSVGVGGATGFSLKTSNMEASNRSSLLIRGLRHLHRSQTALQAMPGTAPDHLKHHNRALASPIVWSHLTI